MTKTIFCHDNLTLRNSKEEEISGIAKDRNLTSHHHTKKICRKAGERLNALLRHFSFLDTNERRVII